MEAAGFRTIATDLIADPAHRVTQQDLLACHHAFSPVVVTNPPFALAEAIIRHLLVELRCRYVALLLKSTFWHAQARTGLWRQRPPTRIHAPNWRPAFMGLGAPTLEVIWCVWDAGPAGAGTHVFLSPFSAPDLLGEGGWR